MRTDAIETRRIDSADLVPSENPSYVDVGLLELFDHLKFGPNLILKGPKGAGKTMAIEQWAAINGVPLLRQDCTDRTSSKDLVGGFAVQGQEVFFMLGTLAAAVDIANTDGACVVVLEEINTLPPQAQKLLNPVADYRQELAIPKIGRIFRVKGEAKVWLIGTMNPNYGGTYNLNEDFRSRFNFVEVPYMPQAQERQVLEGLYPSSPTARERNVVSKILSLAAETRSGQMEYALSTRDLVDFIENTLRFGNLDRALKLLEGKFEGSDHVQNFQARVQTTFQVNLTEVKLF